MVRERKRYATGAGKLLKESAATAVDERKGGEEHVVDRGVRGLRCVLCAFLLVLCCQVVSFGCRDRTLIKFRTKPMRAQT